MVIRECKISNKKVMSKRVYISSYKKCKDKDYNSYQKSNKKSTCINNTKSDNKDTSS